MLHEEAYISPRPCRPRRSGLQSISAIIRQRSEAFATGIDFCDVSVTVKYRPMQSYPTFVVLGVHVGAGSNQYLQLFVREAKHSQQGSTSAMLM